MLSSWGSLPPDHPVFRGSSLWKTVKCLHFYCCFTILFTIRKNNFLYHTLLGLCHRASSGQRDTLDLETASGMGGAGPGPKAHGKGCAGSMQPGWTPLGERQSQDDQESWLDSLIRRQSWSSDGSRSQGLTVSLGLLIGNSPGWLPPLTLPVL